MDLVTGGNLLNILNGVPTTKTRIKNGIDKMNFKHFFNEKFILIVRI